MMLERLEAGFCFYCAAAHDVPGWEPGLPKPARAYRMCSGFRRTGQTSKCLCDCQVNVEFAPMEDYSTRGRLLER